MFPSAVTCSSHRTNNLSLLGQRMASKSNVQPKTRKVLYTYQLRDQTGNNAPGRKSMLIGTLGRTQKGVWVSFDKRPSMGDHTRYWNDDNTSTKYHDFHHDLVYEKGLELNLFSSKKKTKPQSIQKRNQKALIQKIYHQGGKQYEGDLKDVETNHAAKEQDSKRKRAVADSSTSKDEETNKKTRRAEPDSNSLLQLFRHNAQALSETPDNLERIRSLMVEEWANALSLEVLYESLQEAHSQGLSNACEAGPYRKWLEQGGPCRVKQNNGNGDDEDDQDDQDDQDNQHEESIDDGENTDEEEGEEAWEGISDEQRVSAQGNIGAEGNNPASQQAAISPAGGSEPTLTAAGESVEAKQSSPSASERLGILTGFKFDVELGLVGLHGRNNRPR